MTLANFNEYKKGKTFVFLIRHGDRNEEQKGIPKHPGPGLSKIGTLEAKKLAKQIKPFSKKIDSFYCSDMIRTLQTVKEINKITHLKPKIFHDLSEFNKIIWTGKIYHPKYWKHYLKYKKSLKIFNKILDHNRGKIILIVAHGNVIKGIIGNKIGLTSKQIRKLDQANCHTTLVRFKGEKLDYLYYFNSPEFLGF